MAICWNSYRHHLPTSLTDITYRHLLPTSLTDITYRHHLPTSLTYISYLLWFFSIQKPVAYLHLLTYYGFSAFKNQSYPLISSYSYLIWGQSLNPSNGLECCAALGTVHLARATEPMMRSLAARGRWDRGRRAGSPARRGKQG